MSQKSYKSVPRTGQKSKWDMGHALKENGTLSQGQKSPGSVPFPSLSVPSAQRFAGWLAGCSAEQQARWERAQKGLDANPVQDKQLPPALRDGALEVF